MPTLNQLVRKSRKRAERGHKHAEGEIELERPKALPMLVPRRLFPGLEQGIRADCTALRRGNRYGRFQREVPDGEPERRTAGEKAQ